MAYIIAEVGSNFTSTKDMFDSIVAAKEAGADAVKFQLYSHFDLFGYGPKEYSFDETLLADLSGQAKAEGIDFLCTGFSIKAAELIDPHVKAHKVASSDTNDSEFLLRLTKFRKPIYYSTGGATTVEVAKIASHLSSVESVPLYCVAKYPATNINLAGIDRLRTIVPGRVGYSCHSHEYMSAVYAVKNHGAAVVEKHFKHCDAIYSADSGHSINPVKFKKMVDLIKGNETFPEFPDPQEYEFVQRDRRRLVATDDIKPGETLKYGENYGAYRIKYLSALSLPPVMTNVLEGRIARRIIRQGMAITQDDISVEFVPTERTVNNDSRKA